MSRIMGLALLLAVGVVSPAAAEDAGKGRADIAGTARAGAPAEARVANVEPADAGAALERMAAALASEPERRRPWIWLPWLSQGRSGLAVSLSERFSLGVGYRHVEGEDLWREFADAGSVDYDSHNILIRAQWRF